MKKILLLLSIAFLLSCKEQTVQADLLITNANIYTVDESFSKATTIAVKDGKILAIGSETDLKEITAAVTVDAKGKTIIPGIIDAHCHFYGLGQQLQRVDLVGTTSYDEVIQKVNDFQTEKNKSFIIGRGWDQNDWENKEFPTNEELNKLFPNTPVALTRVDGHAMIANQAALDAAGITVDTDASGGAIEIVNGKLTGILVDNPMELVEAVFPNFTKEESIEMLKNAEDINLEYGITTVDDAGLNRETIELIEEMQKNGDLRIKVYAMISNTKANLDYYLAKGVVKTDKLHVRSVKFYADGALGSRGAAMKQPYSDKHNHYGALLSSLNDFESIAQRIASSDYQMNTHAIGDSANLVVLKTYEKMLNGKSNRRWRVEHAQIVDPKDFSYFNEDNIIPSIQPTHATSDMYWAEDRVGPKRLEGAYAYQTLLSKSKRVALGTDYPVEQVSPFLTFYASVARKDTKGYPKDGFIPKQALTREQTLRGMTIWAAYSNFEEKEKGSLEKGKAADFVILEDDIMKMPIENVPNLKVKATIIDGQTVFGSM